METVKTDRLKSLEIPQTALIISTMSNNVPDYHFLIPPNCCFLRYYSYCLEEWLRQIGVN